MPVSRRHLLQQGPVIRSFIKTAAAALTQKPGASIKTPSDLIHDTVPPRNQSMVKDYIRWTGGSAASYKGVLPPHLFPQWGFPLITRTLEGIPYDLKSVLNGGCRIEINGPLPIGESLHMEACLESIDDNGRRAVLKQRLVTGTESSPNAVVSYGYAIVPLKRGKGDSKKKKPKARVPDTAREIGRRRMHANSGWEFALLTGDFNPVHWVRPYAKIAGFKNCILHGYGTLAIALETFNRVVLSGDVNKLKLVDVQFTRPLILPHDIGIFVEKTGPSGHRIFVGDHPGGPAFMIGDLRHG